DLQVELADDVPLPRTVTAATATDPLVKSATTIASTSIDANDGKAAHDAKAAKRALALKYKPAPSNKRKSSPLPRIKKKKQAVFSSEQQTRPSLWEYWWSLVRYILGVWKLKSDNTHRYMWVAIEMYLVVLGLI